MHIGIFGEIMERIAGVLMPVSSLPGKYGIGSLGEGAYRFVDFLAKTGCGLWQVLPLLPTSYGDSPYSACSSNALNPYFIDLDLLAAQGLLEEGEYACLDWGEETRRVDYAKLYGLRFQILKRAFSRFDKTDPEWRAFLEKGDYRDFAVFMALKTEHGGAPWTQWGEYAEYDEARISEYCARNGEEIGFWQFTQYEFLLQWRALKAYANGRGVQILGDMPIYLARDSVETWKQRRTLFLLDEAGNPAVQAGVPPDAFSSTGQLWGNPVYDWAKHKREHYGWWRNRILSDLELYDWVRIDHFIGFVRYYCIPEGLTDACLGDWRKGPGAELFKGLEDKNIVAEDLGIVTDEVRRAIDETGYPGMRILQHAFDGRAENEHKPSNYPEKVIVYTGTHDNETLFTRISAMKGEERERMLRDLKAECRKAGVRAVTGTDREICATILRLLFACRADTVVVPLQDLLYMGREGRINAPSTVSPENWSLRFEESDFSSVLVRRLSRLVALRKQETDGNDNG